MTNTAFAKTKKAFVKAEKVTVTKPKEPPKRIEVKKPLTKEQRAELRDLINEWVTTSNLAKKPITHGGAWARLYEDGLDCVVKDLHICHRKTSEGNSLSL